MKIVKTKLNYRSAYVLLDINTLTIGEITLYDIFIKKDDNYVIIIEAGTMLSNTLYEKLKKQENLYISKDDEDKQILSCENLKYYIRHNKDNIEKRVQLLYEVNNQLFDMFLANKDNKIHLNCVELIVQSIIYLIKYDEHFIKNTMPYFIDDFTLKVHSLHVAMYALALGNLLKFRNDELINLGVAAILHDVGVKKIDSSIMNKESALDAHELAIVQKHSQYSIDILKENKIIDPIILNAVIQHHERLDGSGYPKKLTKKEITPFASILAICDVFDALTNSRPHRKKYKSFEALKMMMKDSEMINQLNQQFLHLSIKLL